DPGPPGVPHSRGGSSEHVLLLISLPGRRPAAPLTTRLSRPAVVRHRPAADCAPAPTAAAAYCRRGTPQPASRRWHRPRAGNTLQGMGTPSTRSAFVSHAAWPPRRWRSAAGIVLVLLLTVVGCYVEANPAHRYGGLHLASHPPLAAYLLVALPALALIWRDRAPVAVFAVSVGAAVAWAALGQIDGAALVPVMVALYWVALTRPRQVALAAGLAGAAALFLIEGRLGPFGWL